MKNFKTIKRQKLLRYFAEGSSRFKFVVDSEELKLYKIVNFAFMG